MNTKKGFTLLELLIVIGILAILSTTIVLVINPAELLAKARDSQRISDLNTLKTAIAFYLSEGEAPIFIGNSTTTYSHVSNVVCDSRGAHTNHSQAITGSGWVPIDFTKSSGGSPISVLPVDPNASSETGIQYYVYTVDTDKTFKLTANMESDYYKNGGSGDVESKDGGILDNLYEIGTNLNLPPTATGVGENCFNGQGN